MQATTRIVNVYEQDCHGKRQFRAMADRELLFDRHHTDFDSADEAISAITNDARRSGIPSVKILLHPYSEPGATRSKPSEKIFGN